MSVHDGADAFARSRGRETQTPDDQLPSTATAIERGRLQHAAQRGDRDAARALHLHRQQSTTDHAD